MKFCHVCGSELKPDATICTVCGTVVPQQPQAPAPQPEAPKPPKQKKKPKNLALKISAAVLAFVILAVSGLFIADYVMFQDEIEAAEYITDFPVLKIETDFVVFDEEIFPSTNYRIKVERVLGGGIFKSEAFKKTEIIIDEKSTEPVYHINFEEDGEYLITLEDLSKREKVTSTDFSTGTDFSTDTDFSTGTDFSTDTDFSTATDTDHDDDDDDRPSKVIIKVTVEDGSDEAVDAVDLNSEPGDKPVEIPSSDDETVVPDSDDEPAESPETEQPTTDPYSRDAAIYTAYLTGGELDNLTEYFDRDYVQLESCMVDLNNDGTYELFISARNTENLGVRGYETTYGLYTINNGSVAKLAEEYYGGGSGGGNYLTFKYDNQTREYVVMRSSLMRDGSWAYDSENSACRLSDGQLFEYFHSTEAFRSTGNDTYGPYAEEIKNEADYYYEDEYGVTYYMINNAYVTEGEYEESFARFSDPTDSTFRMNSGTFSNPLGL